MAADHLSPSLLRRQDVEILTGLSTASIYRLMRAGTFPLPIRIAARAVRWKRAEIDDYVAACPRATGEATA